MTTAARKAQRVAEVAAGKARRAKRVELERVYNRALRDELARLRQEAEGFERRQQMLVESRLLRSLGVVDKVERTDG